MLFYVLWEQKTSKNVGVNPALDPGRECVSALNQSALLYAHVKEEIISVLQLLLRQITDWGARR